MKGKVQTAAAIMGFAGAALFLLLGMDSFNGYTVAAVSMAFGAMLLAAAAEFAAGGSVERTNMFFSALKILSFFMMMGGSMLGVVVYVGAFESGSGARWGALAAALFISGAAALYYGATRYKHGESLAIAREMGFVPSGASGPEAVYDSKGILNGVEVLINLEQQEAYRNSPASFRLELLCRCANPSGLRLTVRPEGPLGLSFGSLPRVPDVPYWDFYDVRCDRPEEVLKILAEAGREKGLLVEKHGFRGMALNGREFKFTFGMNGYAGADYVRRAAEAASLLASRFA
ncbi:MAG TPA: hypothetical protein DDW67_05720 [Elusimicrobia bacterium]|nr:hypothetical protein [Elusimicrobiota bacterium]